MLDTASAYGTSESVLGEILPEMHRFKVVTKIPPLNLAKIEKEIIIIEKEIKELKKSSISNINAIAATTSAEIIRQIINTEVNKSNVSAIVNDIVKREMEKQI